VEVAKRRDELAARVACISFAAPPLLAAFERELKLGVPLYGDPSRAAYGAFGFERGSVARVWLDPRVWASYTSLLARGRRLHRPQEDTLQLGGDVVLDADLGVRWIYRSRGPEDRPSVDRLIAALQAPAALS
jgi:hypothetical protein